MVPTLIARHAPKAVTLFFALAAALAARYLWIHFQLDPWTPDGRVRADIVQVAPDVSGIVTGLAVGNDQKVTRGQLLFQIDNARYRLVLDQATAKLAVQRTRLGQLRRVLARDQALGDLVARETREQDAAHVEEAEASLAQARSARDLAALDLERTRIVAPVDGSLSDLGLRAGDYVAAGKPVIALIDAASFRIEAYFEETKLGRIAPGQTARVQLMGDNRTLAGHVVSVAAGIEDRDRATGSNLLPNVNPTFSWVRLAQRIPVRIALDDPHAPGLVAGRTASVSLLPQPPHAALAATR